MKSILVLTLAFLCANISRGRRIKTDEYYDNDDDYNDEKFYSEFDGDIDGVITNDLEKKEAKVFQNDNKDNQAKNQEKKGVTSSAVSNDVVRKAYKRYLKKLEHVDSQADFDRVFNLENSVTYKRQTVTYAENTPCNPRDSTMTVDYTPISNTDVIFPLCIPVKRCGGCCGETKDCVPTTTQAKQTYVKEYNLITRLPTPYLVNYIDHTACTCQCKRKASDCKPTQELNHFTCQCDCKTSPQTCGERKQWSVYECGCVCRNHSPSCSSGHQWNKSTCQCDKINYPTCNDSGQSLNKTTCTCN